MMTPTYSVGQSRRTSCFSCSIEEEALMLPGLHHVFLAMSYVSKSYVFHRALHVSRTSMLLLNRCVGPKVPKIEFAAVSQECLLVHNQIKIAQRLYFLLPHQLKDNGEECLKLRNHSFVGHQTPSICSIDVLGYAFWSITRWREPSSYVFFFLINSKTIGKAVSSCGIIAFFVFCIAWFVLV